METKKKKSQLFYQFLFSYLIILLIPVMLLGCVINIDFIEVLKNEVINNSNNMLQQIRSTIDTNILSMNKIVAQISTNPNLTPYTITDNVYNTRIGIKDLKNYVISDNFIYDMIYYIRNGEYLYGTTTTYTFDTFTEYFYVYKNWNQSDFCSYINSITKPELRPAEDVSSKSSSIKRLVTFFHPVPYGIAKPYATVIFLIEEVTFKNAIQHNLKDYPNSNTIILDSSCRIVTSFIEDEQFNSAQFIEILNTLDSQGSDTIILNDTQYLISYVKSETTNWTYITLIPFREVMKQVSDIRAKLLYGFILIFIIDSLFIWYAMMVNYNPIKQLKTFSESKSGICHRNSSNEIQAIRAAINHMSEANIKLQARMENSKTALKEFLLLNLLKGKINDINTLNNKGKEIGISFTKRYFIVAIFCFSNLDAVSSLSKSSIIDELEKNLPEGITGYAKENIDNDNIIFIFCTDEDDNTTIASKLDSIQLYLRTQWNLYCTIGVGNPYKSITEIGKSYIEACTANDYKLIKGKNRIIFFNEVSNINSDIKWYPHKDLKELDLALKLGNEEKIEEILVSIIKLMKISNIPVFMAKCLCFDIINTIIKFMNDMNVQFKDSEKQYPDVISLSRFDSTEDLANIIRRICFDLCSSLKETKESHNYELKDKLIEFIEDNYTDYNFSVQSMANEFKISSSYISRYFKNQTGYTVSDYVNHIRIQKAKDLLKNTDCTLDELVTKIGYCDPSSFIKKFKQKEGITPGKYRDLCRRSS